MGPRRQSPFGNWGWGSAGGDASCGPGFRWRFYDRGDLKYVILRLLREKPMHGYEVMRAIEEESGGWYRASPGTVYPLLQMLEDQGFVTSREEGGRKTYSITAAGRAHLEENSDVLEDIYGRVADFTGSFFRSGMRDLTRSFTRLAQVTFERAVKWPGNDDVLAQVKAIIDRAIHDMEAVRPGQTSGRV